MRRIRADFFINRQHVFTRPSKLFQRRFARSREIFDRRHRVVNRAFGDKFRDILRVNFRVGAIDRDVIGAYIDFSLP